MDAYNLVARLTLDSSEYEAALNKVKNTDLPSIGQEMDIIGEKAGGFGEKLASGMKVAAGAITAVVGAVGSASAAFVKATGDIASYGDNIDKMSQKMGMSASAYQEWDAVMQHSGTSMETLKASMKTLANAAETGSEAFKKLGISQEEIATMSQEELFSATITALQNVEDETQRTYLAGKTLGRGATELGALLNTSAEDTQKMRDRVHELGGVMSDEAVKAAATYQDTLQDMSTAFSGLERQMVSEFLPSVTTVMDGLTELFSGNNDKGLALINEGISDFSDNLTKVLPNALETGTKIVVSIGDAITQNLPALFNTGANAVLQLSEGIISNLPAVVDAGKQSIISLTQGLKDNFPELAKGATNAISEIAKDLTSPSTLKEIVDAGLDVAVALAKGIGDNLSTIGETVLSIAGNIYDYVTSEDFLPKVKDAGEEILKALAEGIKNTIPALGGVLDGLVDNFDTLVGVLEAGTAAFIAYKGAMAIESVVQTATTAIEAMSAAQWGLNAALEANPIGLVVAALAGLGVAVHNVVFSMKGAGDEIKDLTDDISSLAEETGNALENLDNLTERERNVLEKDIGDSIEKAKVNLQDAVAEISEGYFSYYENVLGDSENALKDFAEKYKDVVEDTGEGFAFNFTGTEDIEYVQTVLDDLMTAIEDTGEEAGELSTMYSSIFEASTQLKDAADNIDYLIDAQTRLANYQAPKGTGAKFIPTEAIRQMQGKEASAISVLGAASDTEGFNDTLNDLVESAETAGAKVKEALTFDYKDFGNYANLGVVERLGQALTEEQEKASKIASQVFARDKEEIERLTKQEDLSIAKQISLWKKAQAQYIAGSKQFVEAGNKIADLEKKQTENAEKENEKREKALEKYKSDAEKIYKSIESIEQKYAEKLEKRTNDIFNSYSLFEQVPDRIAVSGKDLMDNLQNQVLSMEKFYGDIQKLTARGVSDTLVQEIQGMGVKAIDQLDALLALSDEDLARYNDLYTSKYDLSENIATNQLEDVRKETDAEIEKLYDDIEELGNETAENLGLNFMEQFALGIKGGAEKVLSAVRDVFGIGMFSYGSASSMTDFAASGSYIKQADYSPQNKQTSTNSGKTTNVTVNINGIQYQSHTQLVNAITEEIQRQMTREVNYGRA